MTTGPSMRRLAPLLLVALALGAGCARERERLAAPRIRLELNTATVTAGGTISGTVTAIDPVSGIIAVAVRAQSGDSAYRDRADFLATDSIAFPFSLPVASGLAPGTPVIVLASTINDQLLGNNAVDTAYVVAP